MDLKKEVDQQEVVVSVDYGGIHENLEEFLESIGYTAYGDSDDWRMDDRVLQYVKDHPNDRDGIDTLPKFLVDHLEIYDYDGMESVDYEKSLGHFVDDYISKNGIEGLEQHIIDSINGL